MSTFSLPAESTNHSNSLWSSLASAWNWETQALVSSVIVYAMVFLNGADFQGAEAESFTFKHQIYLRLAICGAAGLYAIRHIDIVLAKIFQFPAVFALFFVGWIFVSVPSSINAQYSFVAGTCLLCCILFLPVAIAHCGKHRMMVTILAGCLSYVLVSWMLYFLVPEVGVWREFIDGKDYLERMAGLGHPNTLGQVASAAFVLAVVLWRGGRIRWYELLLITLIWAVTIFFCLSRTSVAIALLAIVAIYSDRLRSPRGMLVIAVTAVALILAGLYIAFFADADQLANDAMLAFSKSGDKNELTSVTGRSEIWAYAVKETELRPMFGCGYGCARFVMDEHSYHAHNMVLNAALMTGLIGGICIALILLAGIVRFFSDADAYLRAVVVLFVVGGMIESLAYDPCPALQGVLFYSIVFWPASKTLDDM